MKATNKSIRNLTLSAMFLAIGLVLPFLTGQLQQIGNKLLPMHIPVLLCGIICGSAYGGIVGFILPLLRHLLFTMPPMPTALSMAFELAAYGSIIGIFYERSNRKHIFSLYCSMLAAMVGGRAVWGIAQMMIMGIGKNGFTWQMFISGAILNALPGIVIQLVLIPCVMLALDKAGLVCFDAKKKEETRS